MTPHLDTNRTDELLRAAGNGDRSAVNELIDMHRDYLRRVVELRLDRGLYRRVDVSDIIQETHIVATHRIQDFLRRRPMSFKLWLRAEAIQQIKMQRRKQHASRRSMERECFLNDASSQLIARNLLQGRPSQIFARKEQAEQIRRIIDSLPVNDREVILLRYVEELTNAEVAELLGIEAATARKRHGRALKRLFELMVEQGFSESTEMHSP